MRIEYVVVAIVLMLVILVVLYTVAGGLLPGFRTAVDGILNNTGFKTTTTVKL